MHNQLCPLKTIEIPHFILLSMRTCIFNLNSFIHRHHHLLVLRQKSEMLVWVCVCASVCVLQTIAQRLSAVILIVESWSSYWTICMMRFGTMITIFNLLDSNQKWHSNKKCPLLLLSNVMPVSSHQFIYSFFKPGMSQWDTTLSLPEREMCSLWSQGLCKTATSFLHGCKKYFKGVQRRKCFDGNRILHVITCHRPCQKTLKKNSSKSVLQDCW